jgi:2-hydroxy-3-oxopropionate reductase
MTVAVIGLGIMGSPMAANLIRAHFDVVGFNRSQRALDDLAAAGGRVARSIAEAVQQANVVVTMLPDSPDVELVALGTNGVISAARPGTLYLDMSTVHPSTARAVAKAGEERGIRVLDAPVSGGEQGAIDGSLSIMVGGKAADLKRPCRS